MGRSRREAAAIDREQRRALLDYSDAVESQAAATAALAEAVDTLERLARDEVADAASWHRPRSRP